MTPPPAPSAPGAGAALRPVRLLGRGGMGEVWLCRDEALGVDRAVKFLLAERAGDAALRARFAAEARTLAALGDVPGVVRVHAAGEDPATGRPFFVMDAHLLAPERVRAVCTRRLGLPPAAAEAVLRATSEAHAEFAESKSHAESAENAEVPFTLQDALGDEAGGTARQIPERAVLSLAREIAAALASLHGRAPTIVHRDLKPSNLLFAADGRLLLADFGVAKTLDEARTVLTRSGVQPGTQRYAAPELLRGDPATPASDWYALGVVLYRALTSSFPEWGEAFPTRAGLRPFSPLWEPLLRDLLLPDSTRRLSDHAEFSRRLDTLEKALDRPARGLPRRAKAAVVAVAAIVVAGGGVLAYRHAEPGPGDDSHAESAEPVAVEGSRAETAESAEPVPAVGVVKQPNKAPVSEFIRSVAAKTDARQQAPQPVREYREGDEILDAVREFLPAVDRIVEEHGVLLPYWNLPVSQFEANPAAREYRLIMARRALDRAERLRRKAEAGEPFSSSDFSQGLVTRDAWEAWLARRRAEEAADRKIPPASPESGTRKDSNP